MQLGTSLRLPTGRRPLSRCQVSPSMAETAKTIVSTVNHGTLSTLSEDGTPLGTYVAYILDKQGCPLLRLRSDAVHKQNLESRPRCSLFVHAPEQPARRLARITLIGSADFVDQSEAESIKETYLETHPITQGLDSLRDEDQFARLDVEKVFCVSGLEGNNKAEVVSGDDFFQSSPDPLRSCVSEIVDQWNTERMEDIYRICKQRTGISLREMMHAELAWVDKFGFYIVYDTINAKYNTLRVDFPREVDSDRDARSLMTMAAHLAWESDRPVPTL